MKKSLFREKAYKKTLSPEQINDYIKTTGPGVWLTLSAIILLVLGMVVWGVCGTLEITIPSVTVCEDGKSYCYIAEKDIDKILSDSYIKIEDAVYKINKVSEEPVPVSEEISPYGMHLGSFENNEWVYRAQIDATLKDGVYKTYIVSDCVSPISLLWNGGD